MNLLKSKFIDYTDLLIFAILLLDEDLSTLSFVSAALVYDGYAMITYFLHNQSRLMHELNTDQDDVLFSLYTLHCPITSELVQSEGHAHSGKQ